MAADLACPMSHEVIGGLIAGGLTALERDEFCWPLLPREPLPPAVLPDTECSDGGPTLGGECVSGVSGGVCGVVAPGGWPIFELPPPFVGAPFGPEPTGPVDFSIFLYLDRRFWNQIFT